MSSNILKSCLTMYIRRQRKDDEVKMFSNKKRNSMLSTEAMVLFASLLSCSLHAKQVRYTASGELEDLVLLEWIHKSDFKSGISFSVPKSFITSDPGTRYSDATIYTGTSKFVFDTVVAMMSIMKVNAPPDTTLVDKLRNASLTELTDKRFINSLSEFAGDEGDVIATCTTRIDGRNAYWSTTKMERRVSGTVVYRGVQRVYIIPLDDGTLLACSFGIGVLGSGEFPVSDFEAFVPVGEMFIKSIRFPRKGSNEHMLGRTLMPSSVIEKLNKAGLAKFNTRELPSSCGLDVDVYYPSCMKFEMCGFQPHTIGKVQYEWNDSEVFVQITVSVFNKGVKAVNELMEEIDAMTNEDLQDLVPDSLKYVDGGFVNIRTIKIPWYQFVGNVQRMGESIAMAGRNYMILSERGYLMNLLISVGSVIGKDPSNDLAALYPMIRRCTTALTLREYSQFLKEIPKINKKGKP